MQTEEARKQFNQAVQTLLDETTNFFANNPDFLAVREAVCGMQPDGEDEEAELAYFDKLAGLSMKALAEVISHYYTIHVK